jgi:two-component system, NarL family, nitrate/nitrite response regulator NarL
MRHEPVRVVIVDPEPAFRAGVKAALSGGRFRVLGEAASITQLRRGMLAAADVVLAGEEAAVTAAHGWAGPGSLGIFARTATVGGLRLALADGALGYVSREIDPGRLPLVVTDLARGVPVVAPLVAMALLVELVGRPGTGLGRLTPRQEQVLRLSDEGLTSAEIARMLDLAPSTARRHLADAHTKVAGAAASGNTSPTGPSGTHDAPAVPRSRDLPALAKDSPSSGVFPSLDQGGSVGISE